MAWGIEPPIFLRRVEKKPSSIEEMDSFAFWRRSSIIVQKGSFPQLRVKAPFLRRALPSASGSESVLQMISATISINFISYSSFQNVYNQGASLHF